MPNKTLANTVLEYSRRGSNTTKPIAQAPIELQQLWNRGNEEGISMIKVRKLKERLLMEILSEFIALVK